MITADATGTFADHILPAVTSRQIQEYDEHLKMITDKYVSYNNNYIENQKTLRILNFYQAWAASQSRLNSNPLRIQFGKDRKSS